MPLDKKAKWGTGVALSIVVGGVSYLYFTSSGSYLPAWFLILAIALLILLSLSIPRFVKVSPKSLEVHCVLELTTIPFENIKRVKHLSQRDMRWCLPIPMVGIWGVFGYYGYYVDLKEFKMFKLYAGAWSDFIKIEDIYEDVIVINCSGNEELLRYLDSKI